MLTYIIWPVPYGSLASVVAGVYTFYSVLLLVRETAESKIYRTRSLYLDLVFFFMCALHPSMQGLWLSTVCYFYVLSLATLLYGWPQVTMVVVSAVSFFLLIRPVPTHVLWPAVSVAGVLAILLAIQKKSMLDRLDDALRRSVISRSEAELARESERQRIAADFHDGPLQSFISFQMRLEIIRKLLARDASAAMRELVQLQDLGRSQVTELRSFVRNMQPADVTPQNLSAVIREAVEHFERDSGISADLVCGDLSRVDEAMAGELLQIVREALNNVRKHSKASRVSISVSAEDNGVDLTIDDDGSGFPFSGSYSLDELEMLRLGPRSIQRRVRTLGGDLVLASRPTVGANLQISVPWP
ncbi:MAG TPA: sensor histidine kinase [Bryobacteraceae bacterium]|nr:sensor histidine kinase [Bryobacteraceae bacterium]